MNNIFKLFISIDYNKCIILSVDFDKTMLSKLASFGKTICTLLQPTKFKLNNKVITKKLKILILFIINLHYVPAFIRLKLTSYNYINLWYTIQSEKFVFMK